jgi:TPR repeat protein
MTPPTGTIGEAQAALDRRDFALAIEIVLPLAISGEASAQYLFAWMLENGLGMRKDKCVAAIWYDRAARQGHPQSLAGLARSYAYGQGVAQNRETAYWGACTWMLFKCLPISGT